MQNFVRASIFLSMVFSTFAANADVLKVSCSEAGVSKTLPRFRAEASFDSSNESSVSGKLNLHFINAAEDDVSRSLLNLGVDGSKEVYPAGSVMAQEAVFLNLNGEAPSGKLGARLILAEGSNVSSLVQIDGAYYRATCVAR